MKPSSFPWPAICCRWPPNATKVWRRDASGDARRFKGFTAAQGRGWGYVQNDHPQNMAWFKEKLYTGKSHISWENLWFPVDFPLSQPIDLSTNQLHIWSQHGQYDRAIGRDYCSGHQPDHRNDWIVDQGAHNCCVAVVPVGTS